MNSAFQDKNLTPTVKRGGVYIHNLDLFCYYWQTSDVQIIPENSKGNIPGHSFKRKWVMQQDKNSLHMNLPTREWSEKNELNVLIIIQRIH